MSFLAEIGIGLVAFYTIGIELLNWEAKERAAVTDALSPGVFTPIKALAFNLGLYEDFQAIDLIWTLFSTAPAGHSATIAFSPALSSRAVELRWRGARSAAIKSCRR